MAKQLIRKKTGNFYLKALGQLGGLLLGGVTPMIRQIEKGVDDRLDRYAQVIENRLIVLSIVGFSLFVCLFFFGCGILFILIDYGGVPRGFACLLGGVIGLIVSIALILIHKNPRREK